MKHLLKCLLIGSILNASLGLAASLSGSLSLSDGQADGDIGLELILYGSGINTMNVNRTLPVTISNGTASVSYEFTDLPEPNTVEHYLLYYQCLTNCGNWYAKQYYTSGDLLFNSQPSGHINPYSTTNIDFTLYPGTTLSGTLSSPWGIAPSDITVFLLLKGGEAVFLNDQLLLEQYVTIPAGSASVNFEFKGVPSKSAGVGLPTGIDYYQVWYACEDTDPDCSNIGNNGWYNVDGTVRIPADATRLDADSGPFTNINIEMLRDGDEDGIVDGEDNCPNNPNPDQLNFDRDALGDACDLDDDNDGRNELPFGPDPDGFNRYICGDTDPVDGVDDCYSETCFPVKTKRPNRLAVICF